MESSIEDFLDLKNVEEKLTISKVVNFFKAKKIYFTKTMIQNYVRVGCIPLPFEKRYYTKKHLVLLFIINSLKSIYSLEEIKTVFSPILRNPDTFDDDLIDVIKIYEIYLSFYKKNYKYVKSKIEDLDIENEEVKIFSNTLNLMTLSLVSKEVSLKHIKRES